MARVSARIIFCFVVINAPLLPFHSLLKWWHLYMKDLHSIISREFFPRQWLSRARKPYLAFLVSVDSICHLYSSRFFDQCKLFGALLSYLYPLRDLLIPIHEDILCPWEAVSSPDIDFITSHNSWVTSGCLSDSEGGMKDSQQKSCQGWGKVWEVAAYLPFLHPLIHLTTFIDHHSLPSSIPEAGNRKKSKTQPDKDILINKGCLCDMHSRNVLSTWVVGALGLCYVNIKMERIMERRLMNRLNFQQWLSVPPNLWYWVFLLMFPEIYEVIVPCYWYN